MFVRTFVSAELHRIRSVTSTLLMRLTTACMQIMNLATSHHLVSAAASAGPLRVESTADGLRLYCTLKYYTEHLKTTWYFK